MKHLTISFMLIICLALAGCNDVAKIFRAYRQPPPQAQEKLPKVPDTDLAQLILRPERQPLKVKRDPFTPLLNNADTKEKQDNTDPLAHVTFLGMVKKGDEFYALLKIKARNEIKRLQDDVNGYRIEEINKDYMVFTNGSQRLTLKRGGL